MNKLELTVTGPVQLPDSAKQILHFTEGRKVFAFYAEMGAGKTTLIKELCRQLGSTDNFSSPTYNIVNEYLLPSAPTTHHSPLNTCIYHIDLYRIKNIEEAIAAGIEEYLNSGNYCFIEWAELIETLLPENGVKIHIKAAGDVRNVVIFMNHP